MVLGISIKRMLILLIFTHWCKLAFSKFSTNYRTSTTFFGGYEYTCTCSLAYNRVHVQLSTSVTWGRRGYSLHVGLAWKLWISVKSHYTLPVYIQAFEYKECQFIFFLIFNHPEFLIYMHKCSKTTRYLEGAFLACKAGLKCVNIGQ